MTSSTGTVVFNDAKLQAIDVVATERLGVGTLDPTSNLHVVGNVHVTGNVNKLNFTDGYTIKRGANVTVFGTTDVIQEITGPHARDVVPLRKYPEVDMTSSVKSGYVIEASSQLNSAFPGWNAFNGVVETVNGADGEWISSGDTYDTSATSGAYLAHSSNSVLFEGQRGEYLGIILPSAIKLDYINVYGRFDTGSPRTVREYILWGSNDGSSWTQLQTGTNTLAAYSSTNLFVVPVRATNFYSRFRLQALSMNTSEGEVSIGEMQLYGYEETSDPDTSADTKITSQFNLPDTTGVKLYIDGDKGSTPTDFSGEGHALTDNSESFSGNAWSFTSLSTSNVTMSTGDFAMEGDHPHAVSMWFNAANVSSNATLFHVGTAAGEGDAKTAISLTESGHLGWIDGGDNQFLSANTWHNLVYATQGGGGVRTCYLDGRKLGDVSVQDTFGEYPPFAMSTYSQYGYTVSASSEYPSVPAYRAFDRNTDPDDPYRWTSADNKYNTNGSYSGSESHTDVDGNTEAGEWLKIEMPHKLKVSYFEIAPYPTNGSQSWRNYAILGSNDNVNWYQVQKVSGLSAGNGLTAGSVVPTGTYKNSAFKYFVFIWSNKAADSNKHIAMGELKIFGHKENDTTRFPVSSTVLKYPHITVDEPAKRGYVVSQSSQLLPSTGGSTGYYHGYNVFDREVNTVNGGGWISMNGGNSTPLLYDTNGDPTAAAADTVVDGTTTSGEWVQLKLPHKIKLSYLRLMPPSESGTTLNRAPKDGVLAGSTDGTTWTAVSSWSGASYSDLQYNTFTANIDSTNSYDYLRLIVKKTGGATLTSIQELEFYGTESGDVVARVGEGLDGKVANFRVYDKYLHEEQALELWDAQKDQFGRAESSVVVHKGRLGVGTTEPEGRFAVLDEAGEMGEFPPRAMTAEETYMEGHGVFKASASEYTGAAVHAPWNAFSHGVAEFWLMGQNAGYNLVSGEYEDNEFRLSSETSMGQWIKLEMPYLTNVKNFILKPRTVGAEYQAPKSGELWGSKDNDTWTKLHTFTDIQYHVGHTRFNFENSEFYKYYALVVTKVVGGHSSNDYIGIVDLRFFGTRERGQSTLHDGSLTLTKNLTVPRIGPALDADDTPRRDRLVVEYNTSTNPTANGTVKDTSGRGNDGLFYGGASYDATEKALVFDGTDDYVTTTLRNISGDFIFSASLWVYHENTTNNQAQFFTIGSNATNQMIGFRLNSSMTSVYVYFYSGNTLTQTISTVLYNWNHFVVTYNGSTQSLYQNGVLLGTNAGSGLNLPENPELRIGNRNTGGSNEYLDGYLSNFKLYDVVLTADEVKRLYDMGRCDEGHHTTHVYKSKLQMRGENLVIEPCIRGFYEEGTWIPLIGGHTSGRKTPNSANYGWFIRVGNMVTIGGTVGWDGGDSTLNGYIVLDGIPYPSRSTTNARAAMSFGVVGSNGITTGSGYNVLRLVLDPGYPYIWFIQANEHGSTTVTYNHNPGVASSGYIYGIGGSYMI